MRLRNVLTGLALTTAIGLSMATSPTLAAPFDPKQVPAEAKWVLHIDADVTKASTVGTAIIDELLSRPDAQQGLDALEALAGFNIPRDIHGVTLYGRAFGEENNVILLNGVFDVNRILGVLELSPSYSNEAYSDKEIVSWEDKGKTMFGSFATSDIIVLARSAESVKLALDVFAKKGSTMDKLADEAKLPGASVLAYVKGSGLAELAKARGASPVLAHAESAWLVVGEDDKKQMYAKGHVESPDSQQSTRLFRAAEGIRAIVALQATKENVEDDVTRLNTLLTNLTLNQTSTGVDLAWQASAETVVEAIKAQVVKTRAPRQ